MSAPAKKAPKKKPVAKKPIPKKPVKKSAKTARPNLVPLAAGTHKAYMLRTCSPDMTAHGGFTWPKEGPVSCKDWKPTAECGNGLHGLLWGAGGRAGWLPGKLRGRPPQAQLRMHLLWWRRIHPHGLS